MHGEKSILRSYASAQSDQSSSLTLCIVTKFGTTSTTTDQNTRMHNTLSDLFHATTIMRTNRNYGKENNHGSDFCMKDSARFYNENSSETSISRSICTDSAEFLLPAGTMFPYGWFSAGAQVDQSFQFTDATRSFLHAYGSKSAIRCILQSVSKPTLSFSVRLKSEKLTV